MENISIVTGGRVHGFAPFCPFRDIITARPEKGGDSLSLVQDAIANRGFIGVKLYPPMGFAPYGNTGLSVWRDKPTLPDIVQSPDFGEKLDYAMDRLFQWCVANGVPVMAHTNHSNGPYEEFEQLAGADYWAKALKRHAELRVSFGHFGDTDTADHDGKRTRVCESDD